MLKNGISCRNLTKILTSSQKAVIYLNILLFIINSIRFNNIFQNQWAKNGKNVLKRIGIHSTDRPFGVSLIETI